MRSDDDLLSTEELARVSWQTERGTTNYINISTSTDTATALRLQRLTHAGLFGARAITIARLCWGEVTDA